MDMKWIPVEKGLPEKSGVYLCTVKDIYGSRGIFVCSCDYSNDIATDIPLKMNSCIFPNGYAFGELWYSGLDNLEKVLAWMPVPAPYAPDSDKDE